MSWLAHWDSGIAALDADHPLRAEEAFRQALAEAEAFEPSDPRLTRTLERLAATCRALGQLDEAQSLLEQAWDRAQRSGLSNAPDALEARIALGEVLCESGDPQTGMVHIVESIQALIAQGEDRAVSFAFQKMAPFWARAGVWQQAGEAANYAIGHMRRAVGEQHPDYARAMIPMVALLLQAGQTADAEALQIQVLEILEDAFGKISPALARPLAELADAWQAVGMADRSTPLYWRALELEERHGQSSVLLGKLLRVAARGRASEVAGTFTLGGSIDEALSCLESAVSVFEETLGPDHLEIAQTLDDIARMSQGYQPERAEAAFRRAVAVREKTLGAESNEVAVTLQNLAYHLERQTRLEEAEALLHRAQEIQNVLRGDQEDGALLADLARVLIAQERLDEAENLLREAVIRKQQVWGEDHFDVSLRLNELAALYEAQERFAEARPLRERALAILEASAPEWEDRLADQHAALGELAWRLEDVEAAEQHVGAAVERLERVHGPESFEVGNYLVFLGDVRQAREESPREAWRRALEIFEAYGEQGQDAAEVARERLASLEASAP